MFFCNGCGQTFEECKVIEEHHPYGMSTAVEEWAVCPFCNYSDIDEAEKCNRCDTYFPESEMHNGLCEHCWEELYGE